MPIQTIYCNPPICVARLGGSSTPIDAYRWVPSADPHNIGETRIEPDWTLEIQADGSVQPRMPADIRLRDNGGMRPVAPFVEVWCEVGDDNDPGNWVKQPLTTDLLAAEGLNSANISFEISAMNFKVARRTENPDHRFGTFPAVTVRGDDHGAKPLNGVSPAPSSGGRRMIPSNRFIPLGHVRVILPKPQPAPGAEPWADEVNVSTIRMRFVPPRGEFYGPDDVPIPTRQRGFDTFRGYPNENAFLDRQAGWFNAVAVRGLAQPGDTYDGAETQTRRSQGVVDDTSEVRVTARLDKSPAGGPVLEGRATIFCGPPDYSPDRRPFLSLADGFNDRAEDRNARNEAISDKDLDRWVEDLFERAFETVSLLNVDFWRSVRGSQLSGSELRDPPIAGDTYPSPTQAMGSRDALRDPVISLTAPSQNVPLPMTERAREQHRNLSDIVALKKFVRENPDRLERLIRRPYRVAANEGGGATTMQMPPFMRHSNAQPLTLEEWQYDLLMEWQRRVKADTTPTIEAAVDETRALSAEAENRRAGVLERLEQFGGF